MKQRIKLAQAMVHGPGLLFLDEPTNGLDPDGRDHMLALIRDISHGKGVNVLVSSHLLPDIERTCDEVLVMKSGRVVTQGAVASLREMGGSQVDVELQEPSPAFLEGIRQAGGDVLSALGSRYRLKMPEGNGGHGRLLFETARRSGAQLRGFRAARRSLEDVFVEAVE